MSAHTRRTTRINWVSEIQNDWARRAVLLTTYPIFLAITLGTHLLNLAVWVLLLCVFGPFLCIARVVRSVRILSKSLTLRWSNAKPRGTDDWASFAMDDYEAEIFRATQP